MVTDHFLMNGDSWKIRFVPHNSSMLVDRTNTLTVATTDPKTYTVYLSNLLQGDFLMTVLIHELGHCALYSFDLLDDIHRMTYPENWIEMEEFICNLLADYGLKIFRIAFNRLGYEAWKLIPKEFGSRLIA